MRGRLGEGCWFCREVDDKLVFDCEFDTPVHVECIRKALKKNPDDPEATAMNYLLEGTDEKEI